jgi:hypothetical protein
LTDVPLSLLLVYLDALPRLQAEAQLRQFETVQLATSAQLEVDHVTDRVRALEKRAYPNGTVAAPRASAADMAFAGMGIVTVGPDGLPLPPEGMLSRG